MGLDVILYWNLSKGNPVKSHINWRWWNNHSIRADL